MTKFAKTAAFITMFLAILCIVPVSLYNHYNPDGPEPVFYGSLMVIGTPVFALLSLISLLLWAIGEIRNESANRKSPESRD